VALSPHPKDACVVPIQVFDDLTACPHPTINIMMKRGKGLKILLGYAYKQCCAFVVGMFALLGGSIASFAVPGLIGVVVDARKNQDWESINQYCLGMLVIVVFSAFCVMIRGTTFNVISERIAQHLRYDLFMNLVNKDVGFFDKNKTGDLLSRISSDTEVVQNGLGTNISMFTRSVVFIVVSVVILCLISWKLTVVVLGGIVPICAISFFYAFKIKDLTRKYQEKKGELGNISEEAIGNIRTVKAFASEFSEEKKFRSKNHEVYELGKQEAFYTAWFTFFTTFML